MKKITESQTIKRNRGDVINYGDQVDIIIECNDGVKIEDTIIYDITFVRCTKDEFENNDVEAILEKADLMTYENLEYLVKTVKNQSKAIELLIGIMEADSE